MATGKSKKIAPPKHEQETLAKLANQKDEQSTVYAKEDPPDVEKLGSSTWTLLHLIAATYPENPNNKEQADLKQFVKLFGNFYPCWFCAEDFRGYVKEHEPDTSTQDTFGRWLCNAHNEVNVKLGKEKFDCDLWKKRWKDGWDE